MMRPVEAVKKFHEYPISMWLYGIGRTRNLTGEGTVSGNSQV